MYRNVRGKIHVPRQTWYILVCTKTNLVHAGTYQYVREKAKGKMCMIMRFEARTSCIPSCMIYHYAIRVKTLVIWMGRIRYIVTGQDIRDMQYLLAGVGPWRPALVPRSRCRPPLRPWRRWSGHQLGFPGSPGLLRNTGSCHVAPDRSLTEKMVPASGTDCSVTLSWPGYNQARPGGGQRLTRTVTPTRDLFANLS